MPDSQRIDPVLVEKALKAYHPAEPLIGRPIQSKKMEHTLRVVFDELGLKECIVCCNCISGFVEEGPPGATYTVLHKRCNGTGRVMQLVGCERPWRSVEQGDTK